MELFEFEFNMHMLAAQYGWELPKCMLICNDIGLRKRVCHETRKILPLVTCLAGLNDPHEASHLMLQKSKR